MTDESERIGKESGRDLIEVLYGHLAVVVKETLKWGAKCPG
jgi:hypothetical protein